MGSARPSAIKFNAPRVRFVRLACARMEGADPRGAYLGSYAVAVGVRLTCAPTYNVKLASFVD
jgi:hypothetical protein